MGQPVHVIEIPTARPGVVRYETNRTLSGMGHDRFDVAQPPTGDRPTDVLARRLFERGGVRRVHVYGGVVTVELDGTDASGIREIIEDLYVYYRPGVEVAVPS